MARRTVKSSIFLGAFLALVFGFMAIASGIQSSFGAVDVKLVSIEAPGLGEITGKLYAPKTATAQAPAPGVLLMHGYQNDKDTSDAYAIELSRRGYVVLAIDEYGHGSTTVGLTARGYVNHQVKVNYGQDSVADKTYVNISGPTRYKIMVNYSNLSFFNDHYSKDAQGNSIKDSSMGGITAYAALAAYDFVDPTRLAVSGQSMGTWASWTVAAAYSGATDAAGRDISPKATVLQCGELFTDDVYDSAKIKFNNVLLLTAKFDEFAMFRDYNRTVTADLPQSALRSGFLGVPSSQAAWDTTYGSFADGSARRMELLYTNHRLVTHNAHGIAMTMDWIDQATGHTSPITPTDQVYKFKEALVFAAMLLGLAAMVALMELLMAVVPFFASVRQEQLVRSAKAKRGWAWWRGGVITMLIAGLTYPFMAQLGHGLVPVPESVFRMTVGNGFITWYVLLMIVMLVTTWTAWRKSKKTDEPLDYYDLGLATSDSPSRFGWGLLGRGALLAAVMTGFVYLMVWACEKLFLLDFRIIWPFLRTFGAARWAQFGVYILFFAAFFVLNNSKILAQMRHADASLPGWRGFVASWWHNAVGMAGGIFLVILIEYIPFFAGIGPGADLLFTSTFGGPFMSLLLVFFPQVIVLSVLCTYIFHSTRNVFVSGLVAGILSCWIIAGGSAML